MDFADRLCKQSANNLWYDMLLLMMHKLGQNEVMFETADYQSLPDQSFVSVTIFSNGQEQRLMMKLEQLPNTEQLN